MKQVRHYFLEAYPGGKRTMLKVFIVEDGKGRAELVSIHNLRVVAEAKRIKLEGGLQ